MKLKPAYGRNYATALEAVNDYVNGKDFILEDITSRWNGKYCSIRDMTGRKQVTIQYNRRDSITIPTQGA